MCVVAQIILVMSFSLSCADAATRTLARSGTWEAFGGNTTKGGGICGMSQDVNHKYFGLKLFAGDSTFTIQVGGKIWLAENGRKQNVVMVLDGNRPWRATATGMHFNDGDAGLEFTINRDELAEFNRQFRDAGQLRLQFPGTMAADWLVDLTGTTAVSDAFGRCTRGLN
jgi:hypothetical protein